MIQDQLALERLQSFLKLNKLPYQDVRLHGSVYVGYHDEHENLVGSGGLELYGKHALLRSLAIDEKHRGKQLGKQMVDALIVKARSLEIENLYLLTETASVFFQGKGFETIDRSEVPEAVLNSSEFTSVCPVSAACLVYRVYL